MKKAWIFNHYATNMFFDKGGRHYYFAQKLIEQGYEVKIFCANTLHNTTDTVPLNQGKFVKKTAGKIEFIFVKTRSSLGNGLDRILNMYLFYNNLFIVIEKILKESSKPDVIIASSVHPLTMVAGIKIAAKLRIPCICEVRDLWPETIFYFSTIKPTGILGRILTTGEHWIYKKADAIIFTKEGDIDYIKEQGWDTDNGGDINLEKCFYINNGVDIENFNNLIQNNLFEDDDINSDLFKVVYCGAIRPVNNIKLLIEAAYILREYNDIKFIIFGEGNQLAELKELATKEKLNNVYFKGHVNKNYIPNILSKSSVNILNYAQNKFNWVRGNSSNKLFEYMASGKPIISTVKMGYSIIDKFGCGITLEYDTPQELAKAILKIRQLTDQEKEEIRQNTQKAVMQFDFNILTHKLIHVIGRVCNEK